MSNTPNEIIAAETRGRKPKDGERRTHRVSVRMTERDLAILDAIRGADSRNQAIINSIRFAAGSPHGFKGSE